MISIYSLISNLSYSKIEELYQGKMYSDFKNDLGDLLVDYLRPFQEKYNEVLGDKNYLNSILSKGSENAYFRARKTLSKVYRKVGFIAKIVS